MDGIAVWQRFSEVLEYDRDEQTAYVYRVDAHGKPVKPFWLKTWAYPGLEDVLAREGGEFLVMIRRRRIMVFAGRLLFYSRSAASPRPS
jgi:hypothetical protein